MTIFTFGTKLVLIGGTIFATAIIAYLQPNLGFVEQNPICYQSSFEQIDFRIV